MVLPDLTGEELQKGVQKTDVATATGEDGWKSVELRALPLGAWEELAALLNIVETTHRWPRALARVLGSLIPKSPEKTGTEDLRPVSLTNVVYRVWRRVRLPHLMRWQESWLPDFFPGVQAGVGGGRLIHGDRV